MKIGIIFIIFFALTISIFANDSRVIVGRTVEIIDNEDTNIIMRTAEINITLHRGYYEVDVHYVFYNSGSTATVLLGFPIDINVMNIPEAIAEARLKDFRTYINGAILPEYTIMEESSVDDRGWYITIRRWYIREVEFPGNSYTNSRVTYKAPYNHGGFFLSAGYVFGTARNWKGSIERLSITIDHGDHILITGIELWPNSPFRFIWEADGRYMFEAENINPSLSGQINIGIEQIDDMWRSWDGGFGNIFEGWIWDRYLLYRNETYIRYLTRNQVRLFINLFYARHGFNFRSPFWRDHFQQFEQYKINENFSENNFNEFERRNIDFLLRIERMIP